MKQQMMISFMLYAVEILLPIVGKFYAFICGDIKTDHFILIDTAGR